MSLTAGARIGPYEILAPLGAGGMGEVYRARDARLGRDVALKVLPDVFAADPDRMARFEREAKVLAALNHPNIAAIYGFEEKALVLELVEGETLAGPLPVDTALHYALQIACALEAAHEKGIVHRDLKPANVKITPAGVIKVLDFGLAAVDRPGPMPAGDVTQSPTITLAATQAGVILGTASYMAPEQARGKPVDKRADIWAFGCVLYEMLSGKQTFAGDSVVDILGAVVRADPDWSRLPPDTPQNVHRVLRRCLEKDPAKRLRDIGDARLELAEPVVVPAHAPATVSRRTVSAWVLGAVAAAAGGAGYLARGLWKPADAKPRAVRRFKIPLGDARLTNLLKISPDGSRIAYVSNPPLTPGYRPIWVRELDGSAARLLKGTEMAESIVFSPDGKWIAYGQAGSVLATFKVPVMGGDPIRVVDGWTPSDWTPGGRLLLTLNRPGEGIASVSQQGGEIQKLVRAVPNEMMFGASVLPTGPVLYAMRASSSVAVQSPGGNRKNILENAIDPQYLSSGHILFRRDNRWHIVPFDVNALRVTGPAVPLPAPEGTAGYLSIDETGTAVFTTAREYTQPSRLVIADRQSKTAEELKIDQAFTQLRASPDGRFLVLSHQGDGDVFIYDLKRGILTKQTFEPGEDETPVWAPDGKRFAYASVRDAQKRHIVIRHADGRAGEQVLWTTDSHIHVDDWSPDGNFIMVTRAGAVTQLMFLAADRPGEPKPFLTSPSSALGGVFSPDGRWVAYTGNESGRNEIYVRPWPGPGGKSQVSAEGGSRARWSRHGTELFYNSGGAMMAVPVESKGEFSAGKPQVLFQKSFGDYDVLADGRFVLFDNPPVVGVGELDVIENWFGELKRIAPAQR